MVEVMLVFSLYAGIFSLFFRFCFEIKAMRELSEIFSEMSSDDSAEEVSKRGFLIEEVRNGKSISNSKTLWTKEILQIASDKVIDKRYEKCVNLSRLTNGKP